MTSNFVAVVKASTGDDHPTQVVRVANPEDFSNAVSVAALPTGDAILTGVLYHRTSDNTLWIRATDEGSLVHAGGGSVPDPLINGMIY